VTMNRTLRCVCLAAAIGALGISAAAQQGAAPAPGSARAVAPEDLTGNWVSVVTEDWRYRMVTPTKGDFQGVPMTPEAVRVADAWDPAADTAAGNQCKSYGAAAIMRVPERLHITWPDDRTLKVETDAGMQTRTFHFGARPAGGAAAAPAGLPPSWQGYSVADWETPRAGRRGAPPSGPRTGSLKVVTTDMKAGYLRKNGIPYSEHATLTEYFDLAQERNGTEILVVTSLVDDPTYLRQPYILSTQFKKQADATGWDPTPCSATW
jgi:hypothetical protein